MLFCSFQFNPQDFDYTVAVSILLKALTAAPFPDFNLCLSLMGEAPVSTLPASAASSAENPTEEVKTSDNDATEKASQPSAGNLTDPMIVKLATLSSLLLSARFRQFWKTYDSSEYRDVRELSATAHGFDDAVRRVVLDSVKGAFRTISSKRLAEYLDLQRECFLPCLSFFDTACSVGTFRLYCTAARLVCRGRQCSRSG